jgi:hypothetical protein
MTNRSLLAATTAAMLLVQPFTVAAVAAADTTAPAEQRSTSAQGEKAKEKKICHRETPTGSIRPVRICRTQAEIDAENQRAQEQYDAMSRSSRTG